MNTNPKNPHAVALGRLGGRPKGTKGQPLTSDQARAMANARWHPNNDEHQEDYKLARQAIKDADAMLKTTTTQENKPQ